MLLAAAQTPVKPAREALPELWAKLEARLDSDHLKLGDAVKAKVAQEWSYQECYVPEGAVLEGTVTDLIPWSDSSKQTQTAVGFTVTCTTQTKIPLVLMAVFYPTDDDRSQMDLYTSMPMGIGPGSSGRQSMNANSLPSNGIPLDHPPLAKFGQVKGIHGLAIAVGKGPKESTLLSVAGKRLRVQPGTRLVFVPVPRA
jgi:hypothetical protein